MKRAITMAATVLTALVLAAPGNAQETGRTDGPEGSEIGMGGYPFRGGVDQLYISPTFGSGSYAGVTGLLYGVDVGYQTDGWIGVQGGYSYLSDAKLHIATLGGRFDYAFEPFVTYVTVQAGLYSQEGGERNFGVAPGLGVDLVLNERIRLGLKVAHDFILSESDAFGPEFDDNDVNRISLGLSVSF